VVVAEYPSRSVSDPGFDRRAQLHRLTDRRVRLSREYERQGVSPVAVLSKDDLREAAAEGPIVIVNVSTLRCDAIVIRDPDPELIPLPELTYGETRSVAIRYHECLLATQDASAAFFDAREVAAGGDWAARQAFLDAGNRLREARQAEERTLAETCRWLWHAVVKPIVERLASPLSRLWWCPTGPLVGLPLHAAADGPAESLLDQAVSSYTPTVSALLSARRAAARRRPAEGFLLLALSSTPGERDLPQAAAEAATILRRLPADQVTTLIDEDATWQRVRDGLATHGSVHLGCHAEQDLRDPSNGALILRDGRLSVVDLGRSRFAGDFAYLSACKTAAGGIALPEESVSVAAALHFAGFVRVIATLWSVQDAVAAEAADLVYAEMVEDGRFEPASAAVALHRALISLRAAHPDRPSRWSPFVHIGI
jgi:hypothetical protein